MSIEGEFGGAKHLSRSDDCRRALLESPAPTILIGSAARVMEMVGLARVALVVFKMDGWVDFHMEG